VTADELPVSTGTDPTVSGYLHLNLESVKFVYRSIPRALALVTVLSTLLAAVLWGKVPAPLLVGWWLTITVVSIIRLFLTRQFFKQEAVGPSTRNWNRSLFLWSTLSALIWGVTVWLFAPFAGNDFLPLIIVLLASVCGATATLSVIPRLFFAYSCATLLPVIAWLFLGPTAQGLTLGITVLLYFVFVNAVSGLVHSTLRRTIELSNQLVVAKENAEKANRAKSDFLSSMNHELRTPLTAIVGFSDLLQHSPLDGPEREKLVHIQNASKHLMVMIDDILDINRVEAGGYDFVCESVAISELTAEVVQLLCPMTGKQDIQIHYQPEEFSGLYVFADAKKLKQILLNFGTNAIKYNRYGGALFLTLEQVADNRLRLCVRDTGPGIQQRDLERIFDPFERLEAARSDVVGAGIGLSLCRQLAQGMDGRVGVSSRVGSGSTFWVEVPQASAETTSDRKSVEPSNRPDCKLPLTEIELSIVYIEDNRVTQALVHDLLMPYPGVKLITAEDGASGYAAVANTLPDLVMLDLDLPDMNGRDVLTKLRENSQTMSIPVVVVSASALSTDVKELDALGASSYITKPFKSDQLVGLLNQFSLKKNLFRYGATGEHPV
jgi:signal transduction histidine kinase/ActR/RegA family two-component response regulator